MKFCIDCMAYTATLKHQRGDGLVTYSCSRKRHQKATRQRIAFRFWSIKTLPL